MRGIAGDAGVGVAMAYYFFGNKEGLFTAAVLDVAEHPLHQLAILLDEGEQKIGPRLVRRFVDLLDAGVRHSSITVTTRGLGDVFRGKDSRWRGGVGGACPSAGGPKF